MYFFLKAVTDIVVDRCFDLFYFSFTVLGALTSIKLRLIALSEPLGFDACNWFRLHFRVTLTFCYELFLAFALASL